MPDLASALEADARNSTVGLVAVVLAFAAAGLILAANGAGPPQRPCASLGYWPWLFMVSLLFFVAGGFGQAFSVFFAFQIRSWGRLAIVVIAIAYVDPRSGSRVRSRALRRRRTWRSAPSLR